MKRVLLGFVGFCFVQCLYAQESDYFKEQLGVAKQGNVDAQMYVASEYSKQKDYKNAFFWYLKADSLGNTEATYKVARCYYYGYGTKKKESVAWKKMRKAAQEGNVDAMVNLYVMYLDYDQPTNGINWLLKAAEKGSAEAQFMLAFYHEGNTDSYGNKYSINMPQAVSYYKQSAENGYELAQYKMGTFFQYGNELIKRDLENAALWYYSAAMQGSEDAKDRLNEIFEDRPYLKEKYDYSRTASVIQSNESASNIDSSAIQTDVEPSVSPTICDVDVNIPNNAITNTTSFAVVIANEDYQSEVKVPFAKNDGKVFSSYLHSTIGIPETNIHYVENATYNNIKKEINWLQKIIAVYDGEARIIFYYAGHGVPDEASKSAYLLPVDGYAMDATTGYKLDDLYTQLSSFPTKSITILLDACFSGARREGGMIASARGVAIKTKQGVPTGNMVVLSAAQGDETAYPDNEKSHGLFTYYLLKKLQETSGDVTLGELSDYVTKYVSRQSIVINGKTQTPSVNASSEVVTQWEYWKLK